MRYGDESEVEVKWRPAFTHFEQELADHVLGLARCSPGLRIVRYTSKTDHL